MSATRKQEREKEKIIRAAKSRSKQDDPELAKMKEQAKQVSIVLIKDCVSIIGLFCTIDPNSRGERDTSESS